MQKNNPTEVGSRFNATQEKNDNYLRFTMNSTPPSRIVQEHPASQAVYLKHGWKLVPIQPGFKGPRNLGWNKLENVISSSNQVPARYGVGLAHAYSGTMALDVDYWDRAKQELLKHNIDLDQLYNAPDAVTIESGNPGHGKLIYKMPLNMAYPSKKLMDTDSTGARYNYLDFRCATASGLTVQDVLPPSLHPGTQQPYRWGGNGHWSRLPEIPTTLLKYWQTLVEADQVRTINDGAGISTSWEDVAHALEHIPPDVSRDEWVQVGMAIHWAGHQIQDIDSGYSLWDQWSSTGEKYPGQRETLNQWRSFKADQGVTLGTLFHIARGYGWIRPQPDIDILFSHLSKTTKDEPPAVNPLELLSAQGLPVPNVDLSLFPKVLTTRAVEVSDSMGADPLVSIFAGLAVASGVMDARSRLQLNPSFQVPPVLWLVTVGNPADMKSPASRPMGDVLREIEAEDREPYKKRMLEWEGREAAHAASHKAFLEYHSTPESQLANDSPPIIKDLDNPPVPLRITVSDITSQKLVRHSSERPRGLLCWLDEMNSWVKGMVDSRSGENRSTWVQAYESATYDMDRVGAGSIYCENFAVSLYGNIQPDILNKYIDKLSDDGLVQRFVPAILRPTFSDRKGSPIPDCFSSKPQWDMAVRTIYGMQKMVYRLSPEAYKRFDDFLDWWGELKREERLMQANKVYQGAIGKLSGTVGRLTLVWHALESPYDMEVTEDTISRVITFAQDYIVPALRLTYDSTDQTQQSLEAWFYGYILHHASITPSVSLRDLRHAARRRLPDDIHTLEKDRIIHEIMGVMEKSQWVALIDHNANRNSYTWAINPELAKTYKVQREMVITIKQKRLEELYKNAGKKLDKHAYVPGYDPAMLNRVQQSLETDVD